MKRRPGEMRAPKIKTTSQRIAMQIQINTDNHMIATDDLSLAVDATVRRALSRFAARLTRVEAHLNAMSTATWAATTSAA
jgi:hypothetical protein